MTATPPKGDLPELTADEYRWIAQSIRTSASDDESPAAYVRAGWRAALSQSRAPVVAGEPVGWYEVFNDGQKGRLTWGPPSNIEAIQRDGGTIGLVYAAPQPPTAVAAGRVPGQYFDAFLCRAWGETDLTSAEIVASWEGVRAFMVREWLGEEDDEALDQLKADFDEHVEDKRGGPYTLKFEIGGVSVERVTGIAQPVEGETP